MRLLAIDLGLRRTGLAVGDDETDMVWPVGIVQCPPGDERIRAVVAAITEHEADAVVVGLPLNMDGTEGPQAKGAREFGERLAAESRRPVHYQDERLTSFAADKQLAGTGRTRARKKAVHDALAAAEILRDFMRGGGQSLNSE